MAKRSRDWNEGLARDLQNRAFAREFLVAAIHEGIPLQQALGKVIRAAGVKEFAARAGVASPNVLRAINPRHNPTQETLNRSLLRPWPPSAEQDWTALGERLSPGKQSQIHRQQRIACGLAHWHAGHGEHRARGRELADRLDHRGVERGSRFLLAAKFFKAIHERTDLLALVQSTQQRRGAFHCALDLAGGGPEGFFHPVDDEGAGHAVFLGQVLADDLGFRNAGRIRRAHHQEHGARVAQQAADLFAARAKVAEQVGKGREETDGLVHAMTVPEVSWSLRHLRLPWPWALSPIPIAHHGLPPIGGSL
jgi:DNA-binding phage protein